MQVMNQKVLNHPASWLMCSAGAAVRYTASEAAHRNNTRNQSGSALCCPLGPLYLPQGYILTSRGPRWLSLPCVNPAHERNDPISSAKPSRRRKGEKKKTLHSVSKHNLCTPLLDPAQIRKALKRSNGGTTHVGNMLNLIDRKHFLEASDFALKW